jgi:hypothetical protein
VVILGGVVRAVPFMGSDFPLHDGGMFSVMASELLASGFTIPAETSFNDAGIPWVYPPLGVAIAAIGTAMFQMEVVFRVLPFLYAVASVGVFYALARALRLPGHPAIAALAFALIPHAYDWLITGGGVTRGLGLVLAMGAVTSAVHLIRSPGWLRLVLTGVLGGLAVMTHPEAGAFAGLSVLVILIFEARRLPAVPWLVASGLVALVVAAPWWLNVVATHGIGILVDAGGTRFGLGALLIRLTSLRYTGAAHLLLDVFLLLGLVGTLHEIRQGRWILPVWFLAIVAALPRGSDVYMTVPLALMAAAAIEGVGIPLARANPRTGKALAGAVFAVALFGALSVPLNPAAPVDQIPRSDRQVMEELRTSGLTEVAVLTGRPWWGEGPGEWFPAISGIRNPTLPQGSEWLGAEVWERTQLLNYELQRCSRISAECLRTWMVEHGIGHVFVSAGLGEEAFRSDLAADEGLTTIRENGRTLLVELAD